MRVTFLSPLQGHPIDAERQILVILIVPYPPQVSLHLDSFHSLHMPSSGQHPQATGVGGSASA